MIRSSFRIPFYSVFFLFSCFLFVSFAASAAGSPSPRDLSRRGDLSVSLDAGAFFGFTDRYGAYFDLPISGISHAGYEGRAGMEWNFLKNTSARARFGYQRIFYSDIGIQQIHQNFFTADLTVSRMIGKEAFLPRWYPYVTLGPSLVVGSSGAQLFFAAGGGLRYAMSKRFSLRIEPLVLTDFSGVRPDLTVGFSRHF